MYDSMPKNSIRTTVYVVDDDHDFRKSLTTLLTSADYEVSEFASAEDFLAIEDRNDCGCIILDLRMPGMGGKALQDRLVGNGDRTPIIIVTAYASVPVAVDAMKLGAVTVLEKPFDPPALLSALEDSMRGGRMHGAPVDWDQFAMDFALSPRQTEIARLICDSLSNEQIGDSLEISTNTVRMHIKFLYEKLNVNDRVGVAMRIFQHRPAS